MTWPPTVLSCGSDHSTSAPLEQALHVSVMCDEAMHWLAPRPGGRYLDATLGLGGHTQQILELTRGQAFVLGLDRDRAALNRAKSRLAPYKDAVSYAHVSFQYFEDALAIVGWEQLDGILVDLGVSSLQLDTPDRGFSFLHDGPLDMRMDPDGDELSAAQIVNQASYERLRKLIWEYGEEPMAGRIARTIIAAREKKPISTTSELAQIVVAAYPSKRRALARNHPATKTFQALRIEVNNELQEIRAFLERAIAYLVPGGRLVVISFHSLEDRVVKQTFRRESSDCLCPPHCPLCSCGHQKQVRLPFRKPLIPSPEEQRRNSRSRSAKLRVAEGLGAGV